MFRNSINDTPFLGDLPESVFGRIYGNDFQGDYSFVSTLRALVFPRMPEEDEICFRYKEIILSKTDVERNHKDVIMQHILSVGRGSTLSGQAIRLYNAGNYDQDANDAVLDVAESHFLNFVSGSFKRVEKLTEYYKQMFRVLCFINPETKATVIFTAGIDLRKFHFLQIAIPVMLPWYFPPEAGVTEQERAIMESFKERTSDRYLEVLAKAAEKYDFRSTKIRNLLGNFENRFLERQAIEIRDSLSARMGRVKEMEDAIATLMRQYYDENMKLAGIQAKIAEGDGTSEIVNYFIRNKNLSLKSVNDNSLTFDCKGYVSYFDEELAKKCINNQHSFLYGAGRRISTPDMKLLMKALFLDQSIRMKFCARYIFNLAGSCSAGRDAVYSSEFNDCMPNPHIDKYSCLGNHKRHIDECLRNHDYIGAVEQCVSSCISLNFADSTVMEEFARRICGESGTHVNNRCIELPDGRIVNPKEAIQWLKEQEAQKTEQAALVENSEEEIDE